MTNELTTTQALDLAPMDQNPAVAYLAGLGNDKSRRTQAQALGVITDLLYPGRFTPPERPKRPRTKDPAELEAWRESLAAYKQEREIYDNRGLSVNWGALRFQHTAAIRAKLAGAYSPKSANRMLSALRGVLEKAFLLEQMSADDCKRAGSLPPVKGKRLPAGRGLSAGEIAALMAACDNDPSPAGPRDAALIAVMYPGGLRRSEVAKLDFSDYEPDSEAGALKVRGGKGNRDRITYLNDDGAQRAMADWLAIRGNEPGALFWPILKSKIDKKTGKLINSGKLINRRMTNQAVYNVLAKRGTEAGVKGFSPHDLRRSTITDLLEAGADIFLVSRLVGHKDPNTTAGYDKRPEAAKAKAAGLLHLPYRGRLVR